MKTSATVIDYEFDADDYEPSMWVLQFASVPDPVRAHDTGWIASNKAHLVGKTVRGSIIISYATLTRAPEEAQHAVEFKPCKQSESAIRAVGLYMSEGMNLNGSFVMVQSKWLMQVEVDKPSWCNPGDLVLVEGALEFEADFDQGEALSNSEAIT